MFGQAVEGGESDMRTEQIADRVARNVMATGKWHWEISHVSRAGGLFQIIYESGVKSMKWADLEKVVVGLGSKAAKDMIMAKGEGLPADVKTFEVRHAEVVIEEGTLKVFANVVVKWNEGVEKFGFQDVEEIMTAAGLL
jgi:hypothetical protein